MILQRRFTAAATPTSVLTIPAAAIFVENLIGRVKIELTAYKLLGLSVHGPHVYFEVAAPGEAVTGDTMTARVVTDEDAARVDVESVVVHFDVLVQLVLADADETALGACGWVDDARVVL